MVLNFHFNFNILCNAIYVLLNCVLVSNAMLAICIDWFYICIDYIEGKINTNTQTRGLQPCASSATSAYRANIPQPASTAELEVRIMTIDYVFGCMLSATSDACFAPPEYFVATFMHRLSYFLNSYAFNCPCHF